MKFNFNNPTNLYFGSGSLNQLGSLTMPGKKALVLISNGKSTKINSYLDRTLSQLDEAKTEYIVFDQIMENPVKEVIMEGAAKAKENACDFIVALGGGAVIDSASAIAAMATHNGDLWDYVVGGTGRCQPLVNKGLPIVAIATTSGTGSEMNGFGVISNLENP
ncbi:iron-containing alcohol dehydrogenase [Holdemania massiliensis]|uniref:iron-containing alcohol dehydrogenase n=1 Tax=Holdemania massiliensis TaxID=1468449 RepID=UPI0026766F8D|nr:iron-containing alcohol dehydrogenase [Holdemania massiliensis]